MPKAKKGLKEKDMDSKTDLPYCPHCGHNEVEPNTTSPRLRAPDGLDLDQYDCVDCGHSWWM